MEQEINYAKLGQRIKAIRKEQNMTQEQLAEYVGCATSHIANSENACTKPSLNVLFSIANTLGVTIDYLLADQLENQAMALDNEIMNAIKNLDSAKKEQILKMIKIL